MRKIYTCFTCGTAYDLEEEVAPKVCPYCGKDIIFEEPFITSFDDRRIHVDPILPDPNWDKYDVSFHHAKAFPAHSRHGQVRRAVLAYDDPALAKKYYEDVFGWDIIPAKGEDPNAENPLFFCATGDGWNNWEPMFPSFTYAYMKAKKNDPTGRNPKLLVEVDSLEDILRKVPENGGKVLRAPYENVEGITYAVLEDTEGNPFYVTQTPDDIDWKAPENQVNFDVREYPQMYREGLKNQGPVPAYPGRPPKKFPEKDLHGRLRFATMYYKDFRRWQKFWIDLFGWDMIELPGSAGGKEEGAENPNLIVATGPSYYDYEGLVPGHMNLMGMYSDQETVPDVELLLEIRMTESPKVTVDKILALGGKLLGEIPDADNWASMFPVEDPFGNVYKLWKCPDTRTWTDPESGWKDMPEERIDKLSLFWPPKSF